MLHAAQGVLGGRPLLSAGCASEQDRRWETQVDQTVATVHYLQAEWELDPGVAPPWSVPGAPGAAPLTPGSRFRVTFLPAYLGVVGDPNTTTGYLVTELAGVGSWLSPYMLDAAGGPVKLRVGGASGLELDPRLGELVVRSPRGEAVLRPRRGLVGCHLFVYDREQPVLANDPEVVRRAQGAAPSGSSPP